MKYTAFEILLMMMAALIWVSPCGAQSRPEEADSFALVASERQAEALPEEARPEGADGFALLASERPEEARPEEEAEGFYWGAKSNLLFDAALVPHLGVEMQFCRRWSLVAEGWWAGWSNDARFKYWRVWGGDGEFRYWFGKQAMERSFAGHHVGVMGMVYNYDVMLGRYGYQTPSDNYAVGVTYGYNLPISSRLSIDFNIGLGYAWGKMMKYEVVCGKFVAVNRKTHNYFGPIKAEIALVWQIGKTRCNCAATTIEFTE